MKDKEKRKHIRAGRQFGKPCVPMILFVQKIMEDEKEKP